MASKLIPKLRLIIFGYISDYFNKNFEISCNLVLIYPELEEITPINWSYISFKMNLTTNQIEKNKNKVCWEYIYKFQKIPENFIEKYQLIEGKSIRGYQDIYYWDLIAKYQILSKEFIEKHKSKLNKYLLENHQGKENPLLIINNIKRD